MPKPPLPSTRRTSNSATRVPGARASGASADSSGGAASDIRRSLLEGPADAAAVVADAAAYATPRGTICRPRGGPQGFVARLPRRPRVSRMPTLESRTLTAERSMYLLRRRIVFAAPLAGLAVGALALDAPTGPV